MLFLGIDLAWKEGSPEDRANQSGVVALEPSGRIVDAGWTVGLPETVDWIVDNSQPDTIAFIDAPLVVSNPAGTPRLCERQVSQRYMSPWLVGANSTNVASTNLGGVKLREMLEKCGWLYADGKDGPVTSGRSVSECYPCTALVGVERLGYSVRPLYKRKPKKLSAAQWRSTRADNCDELIGRIASLHDANPPLDLGSHPETRRLVDEPSPETNVAYKAREDLLDAAICAWTASLWFCMGHKACQILGEDDHADAAGRTATIISPARPEQRVNSGTFPLSG